MYLIIYLVNVISNHPPVLFISLSSVLFSLLYLSFICKTASNKYIVLITDEGLMNAFEKPILNSVDHSGASNSSGHVNNSLAAANSVSTVTSESNQTIPPAPSPVTSGQNIGIPLPPLPSANLVNSNQKVIPGSEPPKVLMNGPSSAGAPSLLKDSSDSTIPLTSLKSMAQQVVDEKGLGLSSESSQAPTSQPSVVPPTSKC